jgi:hypothetical protein
VAGPSRRIGSSEVSWWRHPGPLVLAHLHDVAVGLVVSAPLAAFVASAVGSRLGADATLLDGGGLLLAEVLRVAGDGAGTIALPMVLALAVGVLSSLLMTSALIDGMARARGRTLRARVAAAAAPVPALALTLLVATLTRLVVAWLVWTALRELVVATATDTVTRDLGALLALLSTLLAASVVGVLHDLARAALVGARQPLGRSLVTAARAFQRSPGPLIVASAIRGLTSVALLASAALIAIRVGMRSSSGAALSQLALEVALVAATCLRASWLAIALRAVLGLLEGSALQGGVDSSKKSPAEPR